MAFEETVARARRLAELEADQLGRERRTEAEWTALVERARALGASIPVQVLDPWSEVIAARSQALDARSTALDVLSITLADWRDRLEQIEAEQRALAELRARLLKSLSAEIGELSPTELSRVIGRALGLRTHTGPLSGLITADQPSPDVEQEALLLGAWAEDAPPEPVAPVAAEPARRPTSPRAPSAEVVASEASSFDHRATVPRSAPPAVASVSADPAPDAPQRATPVAAYPTPSGAGSVRPRSAPIRSRSPSPAAPRRRSAPVASPAYAPTEPPISGRQPGVPARGRAAPEPAPHDGVTLRSAERAADFHRVDATPAQISAAFRAGAATPAAAARPSGEARGLSTELTIEVSVDEPSVDVMASSTGDRHPATAPAPSEPTAEPTAEPAAEPAAARGGHRPAADLPPTGEHPIDRARAIEGDARRGTRTVESAQIDDFEFGDELRWAADSKTDGELVLDFSDSLGQDDDDLVAWLGPLGDDTASLDLMGESVEAVVEPLDDPDDLLLAEAAGLEAEVALLMRQRRRRGPVPTTEIVPIDDPFSAFGFDDLDGSDLADRLERSAVARDAADAAERAAREARPDPGDAGDAAGMVADPFAESSPAGGFEDEAAVTVEPPVPSPRPGGEPRRAAVSPTDDALDALVDGVDLAAVFGRGADDGALSGPFSVDLDPSAIGADDLGQLEASLDAAFADPAAPSSGSPRPRTPATRQGTPSALAAGERGAMAELVAIAPADPLPSEAPAATSAPMDPAEAVEPLASDEAPLLSIDEVEFDLDEARFEYDASSMDLVDVSAIELDSASVGLTPVAVDSAEASSGSAESAAEPEAPGQPPVPDLDAGPAHDDGPFANLTFELDQALAAAPAWPHAPEAAASPALDAGTRAALDSLEASIEGLPSSPPVDAADASIELVAILSGWTSAPTDARGSAPAPLPAPTESTERHAETWREASTGAYDALLAGLHDPQPPDDRARATSSFARLAAPTSGGVADPWADLDIPDLRSAATAPGLLPALNRDRRRGGPAAVERPAPTAPGPARDEPPGDQAPRAPLGVRVGLEAGEQFFTGFSVDISVDGIMVETQHRVGIGRRVDLFFELPGGHAVNVDGRVRRVRTRGSGRDEQVTGLGIRFSGLVREDRVRIGRYVARTLTGKIAGS